MVKLQADVRVSASSSSCKPAGGALPAPGASTTTTTGLPSAVSHSSALHYCMLLFTTMNHSCGLPMVNYAAASRITQAVEEIARTMVERAAEAAEAASREASTWRERCQQQTNKLSQLEQRVRIVCVFMGTASRVATPDTMVHSSGLLAACAYVSVGGWSVCCEQGWELVGAAPSLNSIALRQSVQPWLLSNRHHCCCDPIMWWLRFMSVRRCSPWRLRARSWRAR